MYLYVKFYESLSIAQISLYRTVRTLKKIKEKDIGEDLL